MIVYLFINIQQLPTNSDSRFFKNLFLTLLVLFFYKPDNLERVSKSCKNDKENGGIKISPFKVKQKNMHKTRSKHRQLQAGLKKFH